jgi:hypothetical protein
VKRHFDLARAKAGQNFFAMLQHRDREAISCVGLFAGGANINIPGGETPMPLMPAAIAAMPDNTLRTVRFVMRDGTKPVVVQVANAVLESIESTTYDTGSYFRRFKRHRKLFERMASEKYDKGYVEVDGTVCIKTMDLPLVSAN